MKIFFGFYEVWDCDGIPPQLQLMRGFLILFSISSLISSWCGQVAEEDQLLGGESLDHKEASGDGGGPKAGDGEAIGEVKCHCSGPSRSQPRPNQRLWGWEAGGHQAAQSHRDQGNEVHLEFKCVRRDLRCCPDGLSDVTDRVCPSRFFFFSFLDFLIDLTLPISRNTNAGNKI